MRQSVSPAANVTALYTLLFCPFPRIREDLMLSALLLCLLAITKDILVSGILVSGHFIAEWHHKERGFCYLVTFVITPIMFRCLL